MKKKRDSLSFTSRNPESQTPTGNRRLSRIQQKNPQISPVIPPKGRDAKRANLTEQV